MDSNDNVLSEIPYDTKKVSSISFKPNVSKNASYKVVIKNDRNGKTATYGTVEIYSTEFGNKKKVSRTIDPNVFVDTLDDENIFGE